MINGDFTKTLTYFGLDVTDLPTIGNNVIIGYGSTICGNVFIPDGCAIGACSFVNKSILEENVCYAGSPAKKISDNGSSTWGGMKPFLEIK